jgi:hypothetical protein
MQKRLQEQGVDLNPQILEDVLKDALLEGGAAGSSHVTAIGTTTVVTCTKVDNLLLEQSQKVWSNREIL